MHNATVFGRRGVPVTNLRKPTRLTKLALILSLALLGGCFLRVSGPGDGSVTSELGADCNIGCTYRLEPGLSFKRAFIAAPDGGAEFIRWADDAGEAFSGCPNPTNKTCTIEVQALDPAFEESGVQIDAIFDQIDGFNVTRFDYDHDLGYSGSYRQISATEWLDSDSQGGSRRYTMVRRELGGVTLSTGSGAGGGELFLPMFLGADASNAAVRLGSRTITKTAIRANPWLAERITFGDSLGLLRGDYRVLDENSWERRDRRDGGDPLLLRVSDISNDELVLVSIDGLRVIINFEEGTISESRDDNYPREVAYIHNVEVPIDGWGATRILLADPDTGQYVGYFERFTLSIWNQYSTDDVLVGEFREFERNGRYIELVQASTGQILMMDLTEGSISRRYSNSPAILSAWTILELQ
ncbi:MAG: hypothetical protein AAGI11_14330 [Pseudomonadota bacterium]